SLSKPHWASNSQNVLSMVPLVLAGTWKSNSPGDLEILCTLADVEPNEIEKTVAHLGCLDDPPIWSEGTFRGVNSKLDALYAISDRITVEDLSRFFFVAEYVLSEDDPALDLPTDER